MFKLFKHKCQLCDKNTKEYYRCRVCKRITCLHCVDESKERGIDFCVYCRHSFKKKEKVFKPKKVKSDTIIIKPGACSNIDTLSSSARTSTIPDASGIITSTPYLSRNAYIVYNDHENYQELKDLRKIIDMLE